MFTVQCDDADAVDSSQLAFSWRSKCAKLVNVWTDGAKVISLISLRYRILLKQWRHHLCSSIWMFVCLQNLVFVVVICRSYMCAVILTRQILIRFCQEVATVACNICIIICQCNWATDSTSCADNEVQSSEAKSSSKSWILMTVSCTAYLRLSREERF